MSSFRFSPLLSLLRASSCITSSSRFSCFSLLLSLLAFLASLASHFFFTLLASLSSRFFSLLASSSSRFSLSLSVDHGSPAVRAAVRQDTPSKLPAQLSIWIFITHESDVYKKVVFRGQKSPLVLRYVMLSIPVASQAKTCEKSPFYARFGTRHNEY